VGSRPSTNRFRPFDYLDMQAAAAEQGSRRQAAEACPYDDDVASLLIVCPHRDLRMKPRRRGPKGYRLAAVSGCEAFPAPEAESGTPPSEPRMPKRVNVANIIQTQGTGDWLRRYRISRRSESLASHREFGPAGQATTTTDML
jgi:hypothetical protein